MYFTLVELKRSTYYGKMEFFSGNDIQNIGLISGLLGILTFMFGIPAKLYGFWNSMRLKHSENLHKNLILDLNKLDFIKPELIIRSFNKTELIDDNDFLDIPPEIQEKGESKSKELKTRRRSDELCAVLDNNPNWISQTITLRYKKLQYSKIKAFQETGRELLIISANCLVFCKERKSLILHQRSRESTDFDGTMHTIGGGLQPLGYGEQRDCDFQYAAEREFHEETRTAISIPRSSKFVLISEPKIGFIQGAFLGVPIKPSQVVSMASTWEGSCLEIRFCDLENELLSGKWAPSGWIHVMLWLGLGCPGYFGFPRFNGKRPKALYKKILNRVGQSGGPFNSV